MVVLVSDGIADRNCSAAIWNSGLWVSLASVFQSGINPLRITFLRVPGRYLGCAFQIVYSIRSVCPNTRRGWIESPFGNGINSLLIGWVEKLRQFSFDLK